MDEVSRMNRSSPCRRDRKTSQRSSPFRCSHSLINHSLRREREKTQLVCFQTSLAISLKRWTACREIAHTQSKAPRAVLALPSERQKAQCDRETAIRSRPDHSLLCLVPVRSVTCFVFDRLLLPSSPFKLPNTIQVAGSVPLCEGTAGAGLGTVKPVRAGLKQRKHCPADVSTLIGHFYSILVV